MTTALKNNDLCQLQLLPLQGRAWQHPPFCSHLCSLSLGPIQPSPCHSGCSLSHEPCHSTPDLGYAHLRTERRGHCVPLGPADADIWGTKHTHPECRCLAAGIVSTVCGKTKFQGKIYGGEIAGAERWPWQASLRLYGRHICGAVLIDKNWVATAAHCFQRCVFPSLGPSAGKGCRRESLGQKERHEGYRATLSFWAVFPGIACLLPAGVLCAAAPTLSGVLHLDYHPYPLLETIFCQSASPIRGFLTLGISSALS